MSIHDALESVSNDYEITLQLTVMSGTQKAKCSLRKLGESQSIVTTFVDSGGSMPRAALLEVVVSAAMLRLQNL